MNTTTTVLITGHPATGKTTLALRLAQELGLPLIWKDQIKESLADALGASTIEWSRKLGAIAWTLLYQQVENLLEANVSHIVESNFDPAYANRHWQDLRQRYDFRLIQVRCESESETLLRRYRRRFEEGERHPVHVDESDDEDFLASMSRHMDWVAVESDRLSFDTTNVTEPDYVIVAKTIRKLMQKSSLETGDVRE